MRRLLGMLREPDEEPELAPQPGLAELPALAESVRAAGLPVRLVVDGDRAALPAAVDVSAYRIVQEALTNVLKHAGSARAEVSIGYVEDAVTIEVTDDGPRAQAADLVWAEAAPGRPGPGRDAGAGGAVRRRAAGRTEARGRFRGPGPPAARRRVVMISVLIADDQDLVREGLRMMLEAEPDLRVAGEAGNGQQALAQTRRLDPDVVLMDVACPSSTGSRPPVSSSRSGSRARILMLTTFNLDEYVYRAMKAGASGFLLKDASRDQLATAVRTVAAGQALLAPAITRRLIEDFCRGPVPGAPARPRVISANESSTWSALSRRVCRTPRSRPSSTSARPRSRATWPACWPSWTCATGCRSRSSPTRTGSSGPATGSRRSGPPPTQGDGPCSPGGVRD